MSEQEKYYFDKYNLISAVDPQNCGGTGCCSTCMYRINNQNFYNDYCALSLKEDKKMTITNIEAEHLVIEDEETSKEFTEWLKVSRDKEACEWDYGDLADFFEEKGYETVYEPER